MGLAEEVDDTQRSGRATLSVDRQLHELRLGDLTKAYDLLARQAPEKTWREALAVLAKHPSQADLELAAQRALRRTPGIVSALLELARAVGTTEAAFVAHATEQLRNEDPLKERSREIRDALLEDFDVELLLADEAGRSALFGILARDLSAQKQLIDTVRDPGGRDLIQRSLAVEYERLLDLSRSVRWRSGTYRYFLRHALGDLALLMGAGGRMGELAFRLLQQEVEKPDENEEVLRIAPAETRARFLNWALERENARQHPVRTAFALRLVEDFPHDIQVEAVRSAFDHDDPRVAVAAILSASRIGAAHGSTSTIAERLNALPVDLAQALAAGLAERDPSLLPFLRLDLDRLPPLARATAPWATEVAEAIIVTASEATSPDAARVLTTVIEALDTDEGLPDAAYERLVSRFLLPRLGSADALEPLRLSRCRASAWKQVGDLEEAAGANLYDVLVKTSERESLGNESARLVDAGVSDPLAQSIAAALLGGAFDVEALRHVPTQNLEGVVAYAEAEAPVREQQLREAQDMIERGEAAVEEELRAALRPVVEHAVVRAAGNERLQGHYSRILEVGGRERESDRADSRPAAIAGELERVAARFNARGDIVFEPSDSAEVELTRIRYLALLARRSGHADEAATLVEQYVSALQSTRVPIRMLQQLFGGGPLRNLVLGLPTDVRALVVKAADPDEFAPEWFDHPQLGEWLRSLVNCNLDRSRPKNGDCYGRLVDAVADASAVRNALARAAEVRRSGHIAFAGQVRPVFDEIEMVMDSYVQLRRALLSFGVDHVAPVGSLVTAEELDPSLYEVAGESSGDRYIVRSSGITAHGEVVAKARVEAEP